MVSYLLVAAAAAAAAPDSLASSELQWREMIPGVHFAPTYGDWEKQAHGKFVRLDPGARVPMHTHSGDYHAVVVSGRIANLYEGGKTVEVEQGDYWNVAAGLPHGHLCLSKEPCLAYTHSDGLWDLKLVE